MNSSDLAGAISLVENSMMAGTPGMKGGGKFHQRIYFISINESKNEINPCPARAKRLGCYWHTVPSQWAGGRLFAASDGSPHKNGRNSVTKS